MDEAAYCVVWICLAALHTVGVPLVLQGQTRPVDCSSSLTNVFIDVTWVRSLWLLRSFGSPEHQHILACEVSCLACCVAGAGTADRMPTGIHCIWMVLLSALSLPLDLEWISDGGMLAGEGFVDSGRVSLLLCAASAGAVCAQLLVGPRSYGADDVAQEAAEPVQKWLQKASFPRVRFGPTGVQYSTDAMSSEEQSKTMLSHEAPRVGLSKGAFQSENTVLSEFSSRDSDCGPEDSAVVDRLALQPGWTDFVTALQNSEELVREYHLLGSDRTQKIGFENTTGGQTQGEMLFRFEAPDVEMSCGVFEPRNRASLCFGFVCLWLASLILPNLGQPVFRFSHAILSSLYCAACCAVLGVVQVIPLLLRGQHSPKHPFSVTLTGFPRTHAGLSGLYKPVGETHGQQVFRNTALHAYLYSVRPPVPPKFHEDAITTMINGVNPCQDSSCRILDDHGALKDSSWAQRDVSAEFLWVENTPWILRGRNGGEVEDCQSVTVHLCGLDGHVSGPFLLRGPDCVEFFRGLLAGSISAAAWTGVACGGCDGLCLLSGCGAAVVMRLFEECSRHVACDDASGLVAPVFAGSIWGLLLAGFADGTQIGTQLAGIVLVVMLGVGTCLPVLLLGRLVPLSTVLPRSMPFSDSDDMQATQQAEPLSNRYTPVARVQVPQQQDRPWSPAPSDSPSVVDRGSSPSAANFSDLRVLARSGTSGSRATTTATPGASRSTLPHPRELESNVTRTTSGMSVQSMATSAAALDDCNGKSRQRLKPTVPWNRDVFSSGERPTHGGRSTLLARAVGPAPVILRMRPGGGSLSGLRVVPA
mmetsp:Transcript_52238/g.138465  ORF Transcript_52238/g.138465 Transcript_52238/m.138465 type:complete len:815 (+) Transcript_52238:47-2491(+)